jgi:hypothetical protein
MDFELQEMRVVQLTPPVDDAGAAVQEHRPE